MYEYQCTVVKVVDGDTIWARVDTGFRQTITEKFRLAGINAPELDTAQGKAAKQWLNEIMPVGSVWLLRSVKDRQEKYGRYLGWFYSTSKQSECINELIVQAGHATSLK